MPKTVPYYAQAARELMQLEQIKYGPGRTLMILDPDEDAA